MIKQIITDENNVVVQCSKGAFLSGGTEVDDIPDEVMKCPKRWRYSEGKFTGNEDYTAPEIQTEITVDDLAAAVAELAEMITGGSQDG